MAKKEELEAYPIKRPAIKGKVTVIEDRPIDVMTEKNEKGEGISRKLQKMVTKIAEANKSTLEGKRTKAEKGKIYKGWKKGEIKPIWQNMELYSSQTPDLTLAEMTEIITRKVMEQLCGEGSSSPRNAPAIEGEQPIKTCSLFLYDQ